MTEGAFLGTATSGDYEQLHFAMGIPCVLWCSNGIKQDLHAEKKQVPVSCLQNEHSDL